MKFNKKRACAVHGARHQLFQLASRYRVNAWISRRLGHTSIARERLREEKHTGA